MFAGYIMEGSGLSKRLVDWVRCLFGGVRGGVGFVTVVSCAVFASLTGSGPATVAAIGGLMMPALLEADYPRNSAAGLIAAGGCLGPIIPPSVPMLIYGSTMGLSIPAMFMGGIIPGILVACVFCAVQYYLVRTRWNVKIEKVHYSLKEKLVMTWRALPALLMPVIILGGIYGGVFTPTESAAIAVAYSVIAAFIMKDLDVKRLIAIVQRTALMAGAIVIIMGSGSVLTYLMGVTAIPTAITQTLIPIIKNKIVFMLVMNAILFCAGMLIDPPITIVLIGPILSSVGVAMGIDRLHLGIVFCINLVVGMITPPFGANLFCAVQTTGESYEAVVKGVWPFMLAAMITVIIIAFCPFLTVWLPYKIGL
jgi:C4-dicarboxylate transporter DctM subunit